MKDPAFLFYTKDFQSGTQDMSCEEVGAYLRLLMYQHQHGNIPNDTERMMRITGIFSTERFEVVWQMVKQKFNQNGNHLVNERLDKESTDRALAKPKKYAASIFAGLVSSTKSLTKEQVFEIKKAFIIADFLEYDEENMKVKIKEWFSNLVNQMVNNLANGDANANAIVNEDRKKRVREKKPIGDVQTVEVQFPFFTENFRTQWQLWKVFRDKEHKFKYKAAISEQAALNELHQLAGGSETIAIKIIHQSMAKGWKGFFELKQNGNGNGNNSNKQSDSDVKSAINDQVDRMFN